MSAKVRHEEISPRRLMLCRPIKNLCVHAVEVELSYPIPEGINRIQARLPTENLCVHAAEVEFRIPFPEESIEFKHACPFSTQHSSRHSRVSVSSKRGYKEGSHKLRSLSVVDTFVNRKSCCLCLP